MLTEEAAKALLSSEYSRRRGYLSSNINNCNQLAVTATIAIWGFLVQWNALLGPQQDPQLFATQIGWASALSSILIGLWRCYARILDNAIIRLYPVMYLCERILVPDEVSTIKPPNDIVALTKKEATGKLEWKDVKNEAFGGRFHHQIDWIAGSAILIFGATSVIIAVHFGAATIKISWPNRVGWLLAGNIAGLAFIIGGWLWWRKQSCRWPTPASEKDVAQQSSCSGSQKACAR